MLKCDNWIDIDMEWSVADYVALVDAALRFKKLSVEEKENVLKNKTLYFMFFNQSLRTRSSFQTGLEKMGGHAVELSPDDGIYTPALPGHEIPYATERVSDVARVLSEFGDAIAIRMYGEPAGWVYGQANRFMREFAKWSRIPIINMECDRFHPCQALADMLTLKENYGELVGRKLVVSWAYSGSWHKPVAVPQSALLAASKLGMDITVAHPEGFELDASVMRQASHFARQSGGKVRVTHDFNDGVEGADIVYAKSWCSLQYLPDRHGDAVNEEAMIALFKKNQHWKVDEACMSHAAPDATYMHCLPADRNQEVTDEVMDGARSLVFKQAANRLHAQNAIMTLLLAPERLA